MSSCSALKAGEPLPGVFECGDTGVSIFPDIKEGLVLLDSRISPAGFLIGPAERIMGLGRADRDLGSDLIIS